MSFFDKLKGGAALPPAMPLAIIAKSAIGAAIAIAFVALLTQSTGNPWVLGSLGATCLTIFGYPDLPFSQPRNVVVGHVVSTLVGLCCLAIFGATWWGMGIAVALAMAAMMALRVVHPPAASNPVIVFLSAPAWGFLLFPTLTGAVAVVIIALIYNNLTRDTAYPKYW
jgi:CBS-domain-containing membrane protein